LRAFLVFALLTRAELGMPFPPDRGTPHVPSRLPPIVLAGWLRRVDASG
jgi:hypothetical protein